MILYRTDLRHSVARQPRRFTLKTLIRIFLICAALTLRADLPDIAVELVDSYVYQDSAEERLDVGYFGFVVEVTSMEEDIYVSSVLDTMSWTILSPSNQEVAGNKYGHVTTRDSFEVRAGETATYVYSLSFEIEGSDEMVYAVLEEFNYSTQQNGVITSIKLDGFDSNSMFLDGPPVVPEPNTFALLALGLTVLRKLTK